MPWSPKSTLAGHQRPGIRSFSFHEVMNFVPYFRSYLQRPRQHLRLRRVRIRLSRMFQLPESSLEIRSIIATLANVNLFHRDYAVRIYDVLDELRLHLNDVNRSPEASDGEF